MKPACISGDWALVTGASSGIGREFCRQLSALGFRLVMVARREQRLIELADEFQADRPTRSIVIATDLALPDAPKSIAARLDVEGAKVRLLVNNAAIGKWGRFVEGRPEDYERMLHLNVVAPVLLTRLLLPHLRSHTTSAIINVTSPAALQPVPFMAAYGASKAFLHSFSQALYGELVGSGTLVQTLVPGPSDTEFDAKAGAYESALGAQRAAPAVAVSAALCHLGMATPVVSSAPGILKQRLAAGLLPPRLLIREVAKMFRPPHSIGAGDNTGRAAPLPGTAS